MPRTSEPDPFGPFGIRGLLHAHLIGSSVGGYHIAALLGEGGQGAVYLGVRNGEKFAVKVWGPVPRALDSELLRLRQESSIAVELSHPSLVQVFEADWDEGLGLYYVAMEYVEGAGLLADLHPSPLGAAYAMVEVLGALSALHTAGLLHRDLKPSNVLVDAQGHARLADLGLVADLFPIRAERSGTVRYMAPESLDDGMICDPRSEVYSAGAMLYELLCGGLPWPNRDPWQLRDQIRATSVLRVPGAPRPLSRIVAKAMAPEVEDRYQSAGEMSDDLARYLAGERVHAGAPPLRTRLREYAASRALRAGCAALLLIVGGWGILARQSALAEARDAQTLESELIRDRALVTKRLLEFLPDEPYPEPSDGRDPNSDVHER